MNSQQFEVNPQVTILHKNGQIFAADLSGELNPLTLVIPDLILLSLFASSRHPEVAAKIFQTNELVKGLGSNIPLEQIYQRISHFIQSKLLLEHPSKYQKNETLGISLQTDNTNLNISDVSILKLGMNFSLTICDSGFKIWSSLLRDSVVLTLEETLILLSFSSGKTVADIISQRLFSAEEKEVRSSIASMIAFGLLLVEKNETAIQNDQSSPMPTANRNRVNYSNSTDVTSWEELELNGKIPIYFVPHMENHYPLALGMIFSAISEYKNGALLDKYCLVPITYLSPDKFLNGPYRKFGNGVWLFSNYMWSLETNLKISEIVKQHMNGNLTIHGGPSTPNYEKKCAEFFIKNKSVDIAVHGEGEVTINEVLECLFKNKSGAISYGAENLKNVTGITYRNYKAENNQVYRTEARNRLKEPDSIPSPYNKGYFDLYGGNVDAAIIESNRGCPFKCTFCDWGSATNQKIRKFDLERVKQEIEWIARNNVRVLWIADANFGLYDRDIELSEFIVKMKGQYQFPQEVVVNYTKNTTWRLAEIIKIFTKGGIISQGVISIQTTDVKTLEVIKRKNIKTEKYDELSQIFSELKLPLSTDLMLGLPGITVDAFKNDLQRYFERDVSVKAYPTQLLPNSPMADPEYMQKYQIEIDKDDFLVSTYSYSKSDLQFMKTFYRIYTIADGYSLLRYVLRFLQWDHNIKAIDFLSSLAEVVESNTTRFPRITFALKYFEVDKIMPGGWRFFYDEIAKFCESKYGILRDSAFDTVLLVNELAMPDEFITYPISTKLSHDFEAYFHANNSRGIRNSEKLINYAKGEIVFDDPDGMANINSQYLQYDSHQFFWEIRSSIARAKSTSDFSQLPHVNDAS
ncbi:B12-binding domain-containing radical SAM protein [Aliikangiella coralliicola]|uniref:Radical SAM protein n=1 Tax=Aliikangiella coralliicola TaxID=2592383 RepID=A0A545UAV5_9GAMM|nr:radical SAM protein [Aliikangiella coralliicola]TQV86604.1 radical SAM protein [Aliikangiella coralliicola]